MTRTIDLHFILQPVVRDPPRPPTYHWDATLDGQIVASIYIQGPCIAIGIRKEHCRKGSDPAALLSPLRDHPWSPIQRQVRFSYPAETIYRAIDLEGR